MNNNDLLERLGASNPVPEAPADGPSADQLLTRILTQPREPTRRWARPRGAIATVAIAGCLLAGLLVVAMSGGDSLAERAYAATTPGSSVIHEVVVTEWRHLDAQEPLGSERIEAWYYPTDGRARRLYDDTGERVDIIVPTHGMQLHVTDLGSDWTEIVDPGLRRKSQTDFLHEFRRAYETDQLEELGRRPFDGRDAIAYRVKTPDGVDEEIWYVDPETAQPLGSTDLFAARPPAPDVPEFRGQLMTRRLIQYERLPATAENLRPLEEPAGELEP